MSTCRRKKNSGSRFTDRFPVYYRKLRTQEARRKMVPYSTTGIQILIGVFVTKLNTAVAPLLSGLSLTRVGSTKPDESLLVVIFSAMQRRLVIRTSIGVRRLSALVIL